jgi:hypothetical protein
LRARQEFFRRETEDAAEGAGEIERIAEAKLGGGFLDQHPAVEKELRSAVHLQVQKVAVRRLVIEALKEPAKI